VSMKEEAAGIDDDEFRAFLGDTGVRTVVAPRTYPQASGSRVLTMERFYGCSLTDSEALKQLQLDPAASLFEALNVWFASLRGCDFFHADLHSGNMLLLEDGRVGFIDFGMVGRVSSESWQAVFDLFGGLSEQNYPRVAQAMLAIGMTRQSIDEIRLALDIEQVFNTLENVDADALLGAEVAAAAEGIDDVINSLGEVARNHGIRFPRSFTLLLKQFLYFDRYVQIMDPGADLFNDDRIITGV
jgi:aarF domain-containing kinase